MRVTGQGSPGLETGAAGMVPNVRKLAPQILVAGVLPIVGYALLRRHVSSDAEALVAVMVFPVAEILFERIRHGRFEPVGIIALIGIGVGLIGALVFNGDATLLKVRESLVTGLFGLLCLLSLAARRPAMFYMGRAFATGGEPAKVAEFDEIWELPGVPRRFRLVTVVWGVGLLGEAILRTVLAFSLSTQRFLVVAQIVNLTVIGSLIWFSTAYSRSGERQLASQLEAGPGQVEAAAISDDRSRTAT
jgi:hypothetical protein